MGQRPTKDDGSIQLFKHVKANIVVIGVRKSGMSSIMDRILPKNEMYGSSHLGNAVSTIKPCKGVQLTTWGIGFGNERPPLWKYHLKNAEGLLLIVDSGNRRTLVAMKEELKTIFESKIITSSQLPVVVLANKVDLSNAKPAAEIAETLCLYDYSITWNVQRCSAITGEGLIDGVRKLVELVRRKQGIITKDVLVDPGSKFMTL